jgi:GNAT superfamily N-acetyltransferase
MSPNKPFAISDLRNVPDFSATVAQRVWEAWWQYKGHPLSFIQGPVNDNLGAGPVPSAFVAHDAGLFLGTVSLIASDLSDRPAYTPWVAALWVEEDARNRGIGSALADHAAVAAFASGFIRVYLCASTENHNFYEKTGWLTVDENVDANGLNVYARTAPET